MTSKIARSATALAVAAAAVVLMTVFTSSARAGDTFTLVAVDATQAKVSGATLTPLDVVGGSLDYSTKYTVGNGEGTASMKGSVNGDWLEGRLKIEVKIVDNYGSEFYRIEEMEFTSTSLSDADGTVEIILGRGTEKTNVSGSEVVREFDSGQRITYKVVGAGAAEQEEPVEDSGIRFSDLGGEVQVLVPSGFDDSGEPIYEDDMWDHAKLDMPLPWGTKVRLGERSTFILTWPDMTSFQFKTPDNGDAVFQLPLGPAKQDILRLLAGNLWTNVKKMVLDGSMDVEMGQAVAGIKGTTFILAEDGTTSTLKVTEGTVTFTSRADGSQVTVAAGEMVSATAQGLGEKQAFDVNTGTSAFDIDPAVADTEAGASNRITGLLVVGAVIVAAGVAAFVVVRKRSAVPKRQAGPLA